MIVYTVIVFFAGICLGDFINKNDINENSVMSAPIENEVSPESESSLDSESSDFQTKDKRNMERKATRNELTNQAEKQKDKMKLPEKDSEVSAQKQVQNHLHRVNRFHRSLPNKLLRLTKIRIKPPQIQTRIVLRLVRKVTSKNNYKLYYYEI